MSNKKAVYINQKQKEFIQAKQPTKVAMIGRGGGKTAGIGLDTYMKLTYLPRAKGFFASTTYNQILTKTLPEVEQMWHRLGLREHESSAYPGHYVVGRKPPRSWPKPYAPPRKFHNVITFFNGFTIEFLSTDRVDLIRGGSYDFGYLDEAALVDHEKFTKVLLATMRGNTHRFSHWAHQQMAMLTSVPWKARGQWILDYEQKAQEWPSDYRWIEGTAFDNIHVLGKKGLARLKKEMTDIEYRMEVMNERQVRIPDGFYHAFSPDQHTYQPKYHYIHGRRGIDATGITMEYKATEPIDLSFDFGGWFSGLCLFQRGTVKGELVERCFDVMWVKEDEKLNALIQNFCNKYKAHKCKIVNIYGEPRGHDRNPLSTQIYDQISAMFEQRGWQPQIQVRAGQAAMEHMVRHYFINEVLEETQAGWPRVRINEDDAKALIFALQIAPITKDLKKDKSREKQRDFPQEHATHLTDCFDYFLTQKYGSLATDQISHSPGFASFH